MSDRIQKDLAWALDAISSATRQRREAREKQALTPYEQIARWETDDPAHFYTVCHPGWPQPPGGELVTGEYPTSRGEHVEIWKWPRPKGAHK